MSESKGILWRNSTSNCNRTTTLRSQHWLKTHLFTTACTKIRTRVCTLPIAGQVCMPILESTTSVRLWVCCGGLFIYNYVCILCTRMKMKCSELLTYTVWSILSGIWCTFTMKLWTQGPRDFKNRLQTMWVGCPVTWCKDDYFPHCYANQSSSVQWRCEQLRHKTSGYSVCLPSKRFKITVVKFFPLVMVTRSLCPQRNISSPNDLQSSMVASSRSLASDVVWGISKEYESSFFQKSLVFGMDSFPTNCSRNSLVLSSARLLLCTPIVNT